MPHEDQLLPIYHATKSLKVNYQFKHDRVEDGHIVLQADFIHANLLTGYNGFLKKRANLNYTTSIDTVNFATAAITYLYTDTTPEEGYLGEDISKKTFFLNVESLNERIISPLDFYSTKHRQKGVAASKSIRNNKFNAGLKDRVSHFEEIADQYEIPDGAITTVEGVTEAIKGQMFHETYHHTEQANMHYLSSSDGIKQLVNTALSFNAKYIYGIVMDMYTRRMMCSNCNLCLLGIQHSHEHGFLKDLSEALTKERIVPRVSNLMFNTRVSASQPHRLSTLDPLRLVDDKEVVHEYNPDQTNRIYQAENKALRTQKIIKYNKLSFNNFQGTIFSSSALSKKKLEAAIAIPKEPAKLLSPLKKKV